LDQEARLKTYAAMVEVDRKWISVMDSKASFICALNAATLTLLWSGAKLGEIDSGLPLYALYAATVCGITSLWLCLWVILPRGTLRRALRSPSANYARDFKAVSFYGYVATAYSSTEEQRFSQDLQELTAKDLAREQVEQHFTISHIIQAKSKQVTQAGWLWMSCVMLGVVAVAVRP